MQTFSRSGAENWAASIPERGIGLVSNVAPVDPDGLVSPRVMRDASAATYRRNSSLLSISIDEFMLFMQILFNR